MSDLTYTECRPTTLDEFKAAVTAHMEGMGFTVPEAAWAELWSDYQAEARLSDLQAQLDSIRLDT